MKRQMSKSIPTIYDVAARAGVSISTVSRVLNSPEKVSEDTRTAILAVIDELGFIPKADARARAMKSNRRIGVVTPTFTAPSFVQRLRGVAAALRETNSELVVYSVDTADGLARLLDTLPLTASLDGLIVLSLQFANSYAKRLLDYGLETVLVEYPHEILSSVEIDDVAGGRLAAAFLAGKGHQRLGFVGDTSIPEIGIHPITLRLSGFRQQSIEAGVPLIDENILLAPYDLESTRQKALDFLRQPSRPTAIFAATDIQAIGILKAAGELGLRVPGDLAVMGFDDLDVAGYMGLTTISQHLDESGSVAVELLLARVANSNRSVQHVQLPLTLVERDTV